ncbi:HdeD family acid-resistance protein [Fodinibacter luteus]|uniref:HdeD family acid-resistance protein n=1 Tax=Fodinibacter luteus TaxID=552064 RepID=A0ABP8KII8_9MICO
MPKDVLTMSWKLLALRGVIGIVFGIVAIAWPKQTIVVVVVLWGVWALVDGIGLAAGAFGHGLGTGQRALFAGMAVVALVVAFIAFTRPGMAAAAVTWVLGIWLLVRGFFELVGAFSSTRSAPRWLLVLGALLDIVLGWLFVANPGAAAVGVTFLLGIIAVAWGIVFLVLALVVRRAAGQQADDVVVA